MYSYAQATGAAALQGLMTGVWVAAGELTPARRRLTRAGAIVAFSALGSIKDWAFPDDKATTGGAACCTTKPAALAGTALSGTALSGVAVQGSSGAGTERAEGVDDLADDLDSSPEPVSKARLIAGGAGVAIAVATMIAGRRLEKRWLAGLTRNGHTHPHRALGVRMGLISFAATLPSGLIRAHEARQQS
ncbi:hypothetical protein [Actinoplanes sp. NPDC051859]|uniref:hypothetical protein n=1 Tax=Actinoplanes sp. NPDC051859 TaxID=3363909 RepID=UPI0037B424EF